jgi:hypothetical protein
MRRVQGQALVFRIGGRAARRAFLWLGVGTLLLVLQGERFRRNLRPAPDRPTDFFQEWASARNWVNGLPVYTPHVISIPRYLGRPAKCDERSFIEVNAHPPPCVFLALPLARLDYPDAQLVWNLFSLAALGLSGWIVVRQLGLRHSRGAPFLVATLLSSHPLHQQLIQGQLSLIVLLLITGLWAAARTGRSHTAGALLAAASAVKLFPAFLFLYFMARRQWRVVRAGLLWLGGLSLATAVAVGPQTYASYVFEALPRVAEWNGTAGESSLPALWGMLFNPGSKDHILTPLARSPAVAQLGSLLSCGLLTGVSAWVVARSTPRAAADQGFGLMVSAMVLTWPLSCDHYSLILLLPMALHGAGLPPTGPCRWFFWLVAAVLWFKPGAFLPPGNAPVAPWYAVTLLSAYLYARLGLFALGMYLTRGLSYAQQGRDLEHAPRDRPRGLPPAHEPGRLPRRPGSPAGDGAEGQCYLALLLPRL